MGIIGRDLRFAGYVYHYKILTENIFGPIFKNKMAATGISFQSLKVLISPLLLVLEVCNVKPTMGCESFDVIRFDLRPLLQGQTRIDKLKVLVTHLLLVLDVCNVKPTYRKS